MTAADDRLALVVQLAALTNDRAPDEQRALLAVALDLDKHRARRTVTNPNPVQPWLVALVLDSYAPEGARVAMTAGQRRQYETLMAGWSGSLSSEKEQTR